MPLRVSAQYALGTTTFFSAIMSQMLNRPYKAPHANTTKVAILLVEFSLAMALQLEYDVASIVIILHMTLAIIVVNLVVFRIARTMVLKRSPQRHDADVFSAMRSLVTVSTFIQKLKQSRSARGNPK
mmetsp:Transcript_33684/g.78882  ORF Transcript_33684/g.78882 Transcript_33684/m.78882 type:complete len:127 (-) Transcript_33684:73-453(-)